VRALALSVLAVVVSLAPAARGAGEDLEGRELARQHFRAGETKFRAGNYRAALVEFTAADALSPSAVVVHNIAVCQDHLGHVEAAVQSYREYLRRRPDAPNRATVEARVAVLERARRPADPLPLEDDGLREPAIPGPTVTAPPPRRAYDEPFARRVPQWGGAAPAPPGPGPGPSGQAEPAPEGQPAALALAPPPRAPPPPGPAAPQPAPEPRSAKPVYKQWWFWVFVGVGAIILIDIAASGDDDSPAPPRTASP
jgi:hypothetical protein